MNADTTPTPVPTNTNAGAKPLDDRRRALLSAMLQRNGIAAAPSSSIPKRAEQCEYPVSFAQRRLWFLDQMDPGNPVYNLRTALRLQGELDFAALSGALAQIWARHECIRGVFFNGNGAVSQSLLPTSWPGLRVIDVSAEAQPEERALELADAETRTPFALAKGPLFRPLLVRAGDRDHILTLTLHHIVADAWSVGVLLRELCSCYNGLIIGEPAALPPLRIQYADFAAWQETWLARPEARAQADYWRQRLNGVPPLDLPIDRPRPELQTTTGGDYSFPFGRALSQSVRAFARESAVTDFVVLMAAFQTTLYRFSGQTDFAVGSTIAGRTRVETEPLIGLFMNVLPLRAAIDPEAPFSVLLARTQESVLEWHQNQDLPFDRVVEELRLTRDLSRHPIFQTLLTFQNTPVEQPRLGQLVLSTVPLTNTIARFDMGIDITDSEGQFELRFEYADLFDRATIERFAASFCHLLQAAIERPHTTLAKLPLAPESLRREWTPIAENPLPNPWQGHTVNHLFETQAMRTPSRIAICADGVNLTFRALDERANAVAEQLAAAGAKAGTLVGIALPRGIAMVAALLGVLKIGATYVPLDPGFPPSRLEFIMADSGMAILLSDRDTLKTLPAFTGSTVLLDPERLLHTARRSPSPTIYPASAAYVIYTSGSTGKPKGVAIPHSAVTNFLYSMSREPGLSPDDTLLATTTLSFDIAVLELFLPLVTGARLAVASRETAMDPVLLAREIDATHATTLQATPATWRMLVDSGARWNPQLRALCGGEALKRDLANEILARCSRLWNLYGPTETTVWSMVAEVTHREGPIVLGTPVANTDIHILDRHLTPVPVGVAGELCIGGMGLAIGYLNRPELTDEKFVPHPFESTPGARLYRTGDLARRRSNGDIEFLGRADAQVKVRGYRIEPGEVEMALNAHPSVASAIVDARDDRKQGSRLVAWIVPAGAAPSASDLRRFLANTLPEFMIPSGFVFLDRLPLTPNGKVNRPALPDTATVETVEHEQYTPPESAMEEKVASIWRELLGLERIGRNHNFFELGGHSLLLARVHARVRADIDPEIGMTDLFRYPTVSSLAERLSNGHGLQAAGVAKARSRADMRRESMRRQIQTRDQF